MGEVKIGYLSFRIAGVDGVSLEAVRWKTVLERMGHKVTFIAGELDRKGILLPELHFIHPDVHRIHETVVTNNVDYRKVEAEVYLLSGKIEGELRDLFRRHKFDLLIVANVFSLPMHFPLAVALGRVVEDMKIPVISRNHDFWWERKRYLKSHCFEFFSKYFPPKNELIKHVVINSIAEKEFEKRMGRKPVVIGDSFDFLSKKDRKDEYNKNWRRDMRIGEGKKVFLQATRIVPRKKIEWSIELVKKLNDKNIVLVLAGYAGDESGNYLEKLKKLAKKSGIEMKCIGGRVTARREIRGGRKMYTLWDCFANSDWMTYPSVFEGFGNQFVEACYFRKPIFVNRYEVFKSDIEPLGFEVVKIDGGVTERAVSKIKSLLRKEDLVKKMVDKNFVLGSKHFSYEALEKKLRKLGF